MRYGIRHPVLNDASMETWRQYAVRAWPTLMFVDPAGRVVGKVEGELGFEQGAELVRKMLEIFRAEGTLRPGPQAYRVEVPRSGVLCLPRQGARRPCRRAAVHRGLRSSPRARYRPGRRDTDGRRRRGRRLCGRRTGGRALQQPPRAWRWRARCCTSPIPATTPSVRSTSRWRWSRPWPGQAIAELGAWTAGLGQSSRCARRGTWRSSGGGCSSRWRAVTSCGCTTWRPAWCRRSRAQAARASPTARRRTRGLRNPAASPPTRMACSSSRTARRARYARPTSSPRTGSRHSSAPVCSTSATWDGETASARMQHPLGVAVEGGVVYVADTYNNKIKRVGTETLTVATMAGTGEPGYGDGDVASSRFHGTGRTEHIGRKDIRGRHEQSCGAGA